MGKLFFALFKV